MLRGAVCGWARREEDEGRALRQLGCGSVRGSRQQSPTTIVHPPHPHNIPFSLKMASLAVAATAIAAEQPRQPLPFAPAAAAAALLLPCPWPLGRRLAAAAAAACRLLSRALHPNNGPHKGLHSHQRLLLGLRPAARLAPRAGAALLLRARCAAWKAASSASSSSRCRRRTSASCWATESTNSSSSSSSGRFLPCKAGGGRVIFEVSVLAGQGPKRGGRCEGGGRGKAPRPAAHQPRQRQQRQRGPAQQQAAS